MQKHFIGTAGWISAKVAITATRALSAEFPSCLCSLARIDVDNGCGAWHSDSFACSVDHPDAYRYIVQRLIT